MTDVLGEPSAIATIRHRIGMVYRCAGQHEQAEAAYRQALALRVQQQDLEGEADSLLELGNLYGEMMRPEEAVTCFQQAAEKYIRCNLLFREGQTRSNLAIVLIMLERYDDARRELQRAFTCKRLYGHVAELWATWNVLHDLEHADGNPQAAAEARQQAMQCYMAYRRDGGEGRTTSARLCTLLEHALQQGEITEAEQALTQLADSQDTPSWGKVVIAKLQAILHGNRDPALAADPRPEL